MAKNLNEVVNSQEAVWSPDQLLDENKWHVIDTQHKGGRAPKTVYRSDSQIDASKVRKKLEFAHADSGGDTSKRRYMIAHGSREGAYGLFGAHSVLAAKKKADDRKAAVQARYSRMKAHKDKFEKKVQTALERDRVKDEVKRRKAVANSDSQASSPTPRKSAPAQPKQQAAPKQSNGPSKYSGALRKVGSLARHAITHALFGVSL